MKAIGIALVTSPNFSLSVNWPRPGDLAARKRIARVYEEFVGAGLPATLHTHGRTDSDFANHAQGAWQTAIAAVLGDANANIATD